MKRITILLILAVAACLSLGVTEGPRSGMDLGSGQNYGIRGTTGNETTLQAIFDLDRALAIPAGIFKNHYYFDSYTGDDANQGTRSSPFRSWDKLNDVCNHDFTQCTLLGCGHVWSPILVEFSAFTGTFIPGETMTWDDDAANGAEAGVVLDVDYTTGILAIRMNYGTGATAVTEPIATDTITGDSSGATAVVAAMRDAISPLAGKGPGDLYALTCGTPGEPCILIEGEQTGECRPVIDNNYEDVLANSGSAGSWFAVSDDLGSPNGQLAVQNLIVHYALADTVGTVSHSARGGTVVAVNVDSHSWNNASDSSNNALTVHGDGWVVALNSKLLESTQTTASGAPIAASGTGGITVIGNTEIITHAYGGNQSAAAVSGTDGSLFFVGPTITGDGDGWWQAVSLANYNSTAVAARAASENYRFSFARVLARGSADGNSAGFAFFNLNAAVTAGVSHVFESYESTFSGGRCLQFSGLDDATMTVTAKGIVLDECNTQTVNFYEDDLTKYTATIEGVYDEDDSGTLCYIGSAGTVNSDTQALCDGATRFGPTISFFANNSYESGAEGTNGIYWSSASPTVTTALNNLTFTDADPDTIESTDNDDFSAAGFAAGDWVWVWVSAGGTAAQQKANGGLYRIQSITGATNDILTFDAPASFQTVAGLTATFRKWDQPQQRGDTSSEGYGVSVGNYTVQIEEDEGCVPAWVLGREVCSFQLDGTIGGR